MFNRFKNSQITVNRLKLKQYAQFNNRFGGPSTRRHPVNAL